jgi:hypothetical protein
VPDEFRQVYLTLDPVCKADADLVDWSSFH